MQLELMGCLPEQPASSLQAGAFTASGMTVPPPVGSRVSEPALSRGFGPPALLQMGKLNHRDERGARVTGAEAHLGASAALRSPVTAVCVSAGRGGCGRRCPRGSAEPVSEHVGHDAFCPFVACRG